MCESPCAGLPVSSTSVTDQIVVTIGLHILGIDITPRVLYVPKSLTKHIQLRRW
jgi:hypothetical protein